ncbi:MAG: hypothetical protein MUC48_04880 [Leptolyngbya sp. Prado105]|jgi:hypothetical protein|nr:hypothetical protein [Leptolyngbya sp. Prado105]
MQSNSYQAINDELNARFFNWRLKDMNREVMDRFPFVSKMKSPYIRWALSTLQLFSQEEQVVILTALIKKKTSPRISGKITAQEQNSLGSFLKEEARVRVQNEQIRRLFSDETPLVNLDKKYLRKCIIQEMQSVFNVKPKRYDGDLLYQIHHGLWRLDTRIEVESTSYAYSQAIQYEISTTEKTESSIRLSPIELTEWLGIGSGTWCFEEVAEVPLVAQEIAKVCSHFREAMNEITAGLDVNECY